MRLGSRIVAVALLCCALGSVAIVSAQSDSQPGYGKSTNLKSIAVLPIKERGQRAIEGNPWLASAAAEVSNAWLSYALPESLTAKLQRMPNIRVLTQEQVAAVLKRRNLDPFLLQPDNLLRIRQALNVRYLVYGSFAMARTYKDGSEQVTLEYKVIRSKRGAGKATSQLYEKKQFRLKKYFKITAKMTAAIVEFMQVDASEADIAYHEADNLAALVEFNTANRLVREKGNYAGAILAYRNAVDLNSGKYYKAAHFYENKYRIFQVLNSYGEERKLLQEEHIELFLADTDKYLESANDLADAYEAYFLFEEAIATRKRLLYLFDTQNKKFVWKSPLEQVVNSDLVVYKGVLYAAAVSDYIYAIRTDNGARKWRYNINTRILSAPVVAGNMLYIGGENGTLYAIRCDNGEVMWRYATKGPIINSPVIVGEAVYCASRDGNIYKLNRNNGRLLEKYEIGVPVVSPLVFNKDQVFFGVDRIEGDNFYIYDLKKRMIWQQITVPIGNTTRPLINFRSVIVGANDGTVYAFRLKSGEQSWSHALNGTIDTSNPLLHNNKVFIATSSGDIYALDAITGSELWSFQAGGAISRSSLVLQQGLLYVGCDDFNLYVLNADSGRIAWTYQAGGGVDSTPAVKGNNVYLAASDKRIYALNNRVEPLAEFDFKYADLLFKIAISCINQGDYSEAIKYLKATIDEESNYPGVHKELQFAQDAAQQNYRRSSR